MHPDLVKLLDLQEKDTVLLDVDTRLQEVLTEVDALDRDIALGQQAIEAARRAAAEGAQKRDQLEAKIESYRLLQERRRQRLEHVRQAKEAAQLMADLDLARTVLAKEESDWMRLAEAVNALEAKVVEAEQKLAGLQATQLPAREALAAREAELVAERDVAVQAREESAAQLEKTLRMRYDRLRRSRGTQVVVALDGTACGACYTTVPLNRRSQIRTGLLLDGCEVCGVILYSTDQVQVGS